MTALALIRFVHFMAAMLAFGMSAYLWLYAPERLRLALSPAARRLALIASVVALLTAVAWLQLEAAAMAGDLSAALDVSVIGTVLSDTAFGHAWAAHLVLAAALVAVVILARASAGRRHRSLRRRCWRASASSATRRCRPGPKAFCTA